MKIIIPASGVGQRFMDAGYEETKPLIPVLGDKRIMNYVFDMFDVENDEFIIITSEYTYNEMDEWLEKQEGLNYTHILTRGPKLGPVGAITSTYPEVEQHIHDDEPVIVSYCDFGMDWDYKDFLTFCKDTKADGVISSYTGYHPHLPPEENVYARSRCVSDAYGNHGVLNVQEKYKSNDKFNEQWSSGLYYFKSMKTMKNAFEGLIEADDRLNGEFYVSLAYNYFHRSDSILSYDKVNKFYQFGTPKDFEYVKGKLNDLDKMANIKRDVEVKNTVFLSAGRGERFMGLGFDQPKPFLPIKNNDILHESMETFNRGGEFRFVGATDHSLFWQLSPYWKNTKLIPANKIGAAFSYNAGCNDLKGSTLIAPCDLVANHYENSFRAMINADADVVIFTTTPTKYQRDNVNSFAWVTGDEETDEVLTIDIKKPNDRVAITDQMVLIGSFYVKSNELLIEAIREIIDQNLQTNGEYYLDNAFKYLLDNKDELGIKVAYSELENYFSLGTPDEYKENKYWLE